MGGAEDKPNSATASKLSEVIEKSPDQPTAASSAAKGPSALDDLLGLEGSFTRDRPPQANPWGTAAPQPTVSSNPFQPVNTVSFPNSTSDPWSQTSSGNAVSITVRNIHILVTDIVTSYTAVKCGIDDVD